MTDRYIHDVIEKYNASDFTEAKPTCGYAFVTGTTRERETIQLEVNSEIDVSFDLLSLIEKPEVRVYVLGLFSDDELKAELKERG